MSETPTETVTETSSPPPPPPEAPSDILPPRDGAWQAMSLEAKIGALDDAVRMLEMTVKSVSARLRYLGEAIALMTLYQADMNNRTFALADACLTIAKAMEKGNADHPRGNLHRRVLDMMTPTLEEQDARAMRIGTMLTQHANSKAPPADPPPGEATSAPASPQDPSPSTPSTGSTPSAVDFGEI